MALGKSALQRMHSSCPADTKELSLSYEKETTHFLLLANHMGTHLSSISCPEMMTMIRTDLNPTDLAFACKLAYAHLLIRYLKHLCFLAELQTEFISYDIVPVH